MWVRLTRNGYRAVLHVSAMDADMQEAFQREVLHVGQRVDVCAPYAAWRFAQVMLHDRTFGPRGGRQKQATREFVALRTITREINYIDTHPALKGVGMLEWQPFWLPAWELDSPRDGRLYSPYPLRDRPFVTLNPIWNTLGDRTKVTTWVVDRPPASDWRGLLADEGTHLRLWRQRCT